VHDCPTIITYTAAKQDAKHNRESTAFGTVECLTDNIPSPEIERHTDVQKVIPQNAIRITISCHKGTCTMHYLT